MGSVHGDDAGGGHGLRTLRWVGVVPAAAAAGFAVDTLARIASRSLALVVTGPDGFRDAMSRLSLPAYALGSAGFVAAGAALAPRVRVATAGSLAAARVVYALATHILTPRVIGPTNLWHVSLETAGAFAGVALVTLVERCHQRAGFRPPEARGRSSGTEGARSG